jgi:hypothetical protein
MSDQSDDAPVAVTTRVPTDDGSSAIDADDCIMPHMRPERD